MTSLKDKTISPQRAQRAAEEKVEPFFLSSFPDSLFLGMISRNGPFVAQ
jgi:hypothetical protein